MTEPGWYNDERDPLIARWHDGAGWTEHTIVKSTWAGPALPPPPEPEPTAWIPAVAREAASTLPPPPTAPLPAVPPLSPAPSKVGLVDRFKAWPTWARVAAPVAAVLVVIAAATGSGGDDGERASTTDSTKRTTLEKTTTTTERKTTFAEAISVAQRALDAPVDANQLGHVIAGLCAGQVEPAARDAAAMTDDFEQLADIVEASGDGAEVYCPETVAGEPQLVQSVYDAALPMVVPPTTAPPATNPPAPPGTQRPATATTKPTSPPSTSPPATNPPSSGCDPNYSGCLNPNSPDYDCAGGSGNGPDYTGPVQVLGTDHYGLDSNGDGYGCENS